MTDPKPAESSLGEEFVSHLEGHFFCVRPDCDGNLRNNNGDGAIVAHADVTAEQLKLRVDNSIVGSRWWFAHSAALQYVEGRRCSHGVEQ